LSEKGKNAELLKRIEDVARNERNGLLIIPMGVFLVGVGLILGVIGNSEFAYIGGISISTLGVFSTFLGFYVTVHYAHKHNDLISEMESTV